MNIHLLVIDPQNDFCDPNGSLYVQGAEGDMDRLSLFLKNNGKKIKDVHVTFDSHHRFDIAHPLFWQDSGGSNPAPFTVISADDVRTGKWQTSIPQLRNRAISYLEGLESNNRYNCMIWPEHCLIGSPGSNVFPTFFDALLEWEGSKIGRIVNKVTKGSNPFSEHYSAVQAEVPDPSDATTQLNTSLIKTLQDADEIVVAGEALSHCLANTVRDIAANFGDDEIRKLVLLTDASSNVANLEQLGEDFVREMTQRGMRVSSTTDYLK
jgi:nicotinamidase-related amidase